MLLIGRISQGTFDTMEKKLDHVTSIVSDLREVLEKEEIIWQSGLSEQKRILESLLIELELKRLLGEIREEDWTQKSMIISSGLNSLMNNRTPTNKAKPKPAPPIQPTLEERAGEEIRTAKQRRDKRVRRIIKEPPRQLKSFSGSRVRCMNPWNPKCKDTHIELSIYYNGQMTPICRRCWEQLSKKNIEWSSL